MNKGVFDIGGNSVKYKINNESIESFSTINKGKEYVLSYIAKIINDNNIEYVGISSPCGVDYKTGQLYGISGIKNYENFNLYNELKSLINHEFIIVAHNDANAALLGNLVGENYSSAAQITVGTGIGGAIYTNNEIVTNKLAMAGEFGYIPFDEKHTISEMCSANSLVQMINESNNTKYTNFEEVITSKKSFYKEISIWADNFSKLIIQIFFSISPEVIFISGGIIKNKNIQKHISESFQKHMNHFKYKFEFKIVFKNIDNPALLGMNKTLLNLIKK